MKIKNSIFLVIVYSIKSGWKVVFCIQENPVDAPPRIAETLILSLTCVDAILGLGLKVVILAKIPMLIFFIKGVRRFGGLKVLLCRGSKTELPTAWVNAD